MNNVAPIATMVTKEGEIFAYRENRDGPYKGTVENSAE